MKNLRRLCAGLVLTLALAAPAFAGQVDCPGVTQPPPTEEATVAGEMPNGIDSSDTPGAVIEAVFSVIVTMLSLS